MEGARYPNLWHTDRCIAMKDYTDYLAVIFTKDLQWHLFRQDMSSAKRISSLPYRGQSYHLAYSKAHNIKWYPWIDWFWRNPLEMMRYIYISRAHRVGLLVFKESEPGSVNEPIHISETIPEYAEVFSPAAVRVQVLSKNFVTYQKSQKFQTGAWGSTWMIYLVIGVVILLGALYFTGHLR